MELQQPLEAAFWSLMSRSFACGDMARPSGTVFSQALRMSEWRRFIDECFPCEAMVSDVFLRGFDLSLACHFAWRFQTDLLLKYFRLHDLQVSPVFMAWYSSYPDQAVLATDDHARLVNVWRQSAQTLFAPGSLENSMYQSFGNTEEQLSFNTELDHLNFLVSFQPAIIIQSDSIDALSPVARLFLAVATNNVAQVLNLSDSCFGTVSSFFVFQGLFRSMQLPKAIFQVFPHQNLHDKIWQRFMHAMKHKPALSEECQLLQQHFEP